MNKTCMYGLTLIGVLAAGAAAKAQTRDPQQALDRIMIFQERQYEHESRQNPVDEKFVDNEMKKMARSALQGVDSSKIDDRQGMVWAQLYYYAKQHQTACNVLGKYLNTGLTPKELFSAKMFLLTNYRMLGNADKVNDLLRQVKPVNESQSMLLGDVGPSQLADFIAKSKGPMVAFEALKVAQSNTATQMGRQTVAPSNAAAMQRRMKAMECGFVLKEADLLGRAGRKGEAVQLLQGFEASLPATSKLLPAVRSKQSALRAMK